MWLAKEWLLVGLVSLVTAPQSCERRRTGAPEPPQIVVGQDVSSVITSRDRPCTGSFAPCRVFQVSVDKQGVLRATLTWSTKTNGLQLELWNGNDGDGTCCHSGESVSVPVTEGDRAEIHVILAESKTSDARLSFELNTSIRRLRSELDPNGTPRSGQTAAVDRSASTESHPTVSSQRPRTDRVNPTCA